MVDNFEKSLDFVFRWEGGISNDSDDPGGETKFGISARSHPDIDITQLTKRDAIETYRRDYWPVASGFKWPACLAVLDAAVNCGNNKAQAFIDESIRDWDGPGPIPAMELALMICAARDKFYAKLAAKKPVMRKYIIGWSNRVNALRKIASEKSIESSDMVIS